MANLNKIRQIAEKRNLTIRELAEKVGLKENQIHVMCRTNSTKIDTLERIANVLDVSVAIFFDEAFDSMYTEGNLSPVTINGNSTIALGDSIMAERIRSLESIIAEKNERIKELKERIEDLKSNK